MTSRVKTQIPDTYGFHVFSSMVTMQLFTYLINLNNQNITLLVNLCDEHCDLLMNKLYMLPSGNIALLVIIYLLFTLVVVSNIIKSKNSSLQSS